MREQRHPEYPPGAWVFVSHSHKDLAKVRQIRDTLEKEGFKPLLFYLKCLEDDSAELPELLRREIEARNVFILCDSGHSRSSKWVQDEVEIIRSLEGKIYEVVDLDRGIDEYLQKVTKLSRRATVFLSYSVRDSDAAGKIADRLRREEYRVFDVRSNLAGENFPAQVASAIDEAARRGFVLVLLSKSTGESRFVQDEVRYAFQIKSVIVPVMVDDAQSVLTSLPDHIRWMLWSLQYFELAGRPFEEAMSDLISLLRKRDIE